MSNKKPNRLINEKSPYLLQHAYNPVNWYPWGDEVFDRANNEDKLILLSIGYSTCHWCHVMAHDTFNDEETAKYLNDNFLAIKVDREERPDIDEIYMLVCQIMSGNCGWPLNLILTPDKKPIFAGTYFPSKESRGMPSFLKILEEIDHIWENNRIEVSQVANEISERINTIQQREISKEQINKNTLDKAFKTLSGEFDEVYGGFGREPKFPTSHNLSFLFRLYKESKDQRMLEMVEKTLRSMYSGGIFDHVGGGFHRYSTDNMWLIPHFEKMLYDQALIANVYIEAYQVTENEFYADIAKKTLDFVLNELTSPEGAFYSGIDADTEGEEGKFYVWTKDEIFKILKEDADLFCRFYGVTRNGNFGEGKNVLFIPNSIENFTEKYNLDPDKFKNNLDNCLKKLYEARNKRIYPHVDDKIISSWNGLFIKALALAGRVFNDKKYKIAAIKAGEFIVENLITPGGNVIRSYRNGKSDISGFLEDYAFLAYGFLELYEATFDTVFLELSKDLANKIIDEFYDEVNGGFFSTSINSDTPLTRIKDATDNAVPSGNSIAALVFLILGDITENQNYTDMATRSFNYFGSMVNQYPVSFTQFLISVIYYIGRHRVFLIAENPEDKNTDKIIEALNRHLFQDSIMLFKSQENAGIEKICPLAKDKQALDSKTEIFICEKAACKTPLKGLPALNGYLAKEG